VTEALVSVEPGAGDTIGGGKLLGVAVVSLLIDVVEVLGAVWLFDAAIVLDTSGDGRLSFPDAS
jgi:hypothetical protein